MRRRRRNLNMNMWAMNTISYGTDNEFHLGNIQFNGTFTAFSLYKNNFIAH
jgi:hypothetical protein